MIDLTQSTIFKIHEPQRKGGFKKLAATDMKPYLLESKQSADSFEDVALDLDSKTKEEALQTHLREIGE